MKYIRFFPIIFIILTKLVLANVPLVIPDLNRQFTASVKVGDWIFRKGIQVDSLIVNQISGGDFSHIGMIISIEPEVKIIHATTSDDVNYPNQVIISSLAEFIAPEFAEKYAVARPNFLSERQKQQIVEDILTKKGEEFVLASRDQPHLYCTTLLFDSIVKVQPDFNPEWTYSHVPLLTGIYLFPNAFAHYPDITWIYKYPEVN
ncbi:hypothetical protein A9G09_11605 [Gilliamella sp. wkB292]|uniref:YiiX/YebB-like N1pC/P60 family cysteine hydrolase n=1 Tax=Gilliamella sp. wkB292 TaxID=3120262 RepID=UPI00080D9E21|nr:YiiX/YebB-like N1pC/P60 family cysteine hydrolase [Gilliamella apicola]OCG10938.1 hypothetical protein A9G09_11605 [Gilliamella apicola]